MAKKIDAKRWKNEFTLRNGEYFARMPYYQEWRSEFGRSTARTACGFCNEPHEVFIWSFQGGGKRCDNCNALMLPGGTYAKKEQVINLIKPVTT